MPEATRILLANEKGSLQFHLAPARADVVVVAEDLDVGIDLEKHLGLAVELLVEYLEVVQGTTWRLACNVAQTSPDTAAARTICERFCRDEWVNGPMSGLDHFDLSAQSKVQFAENLEVFNRVRFRSGNLVSPLDHQSKGVGVVVDQGLVTANQGSVDGELSVEEIRRFFGSAPSELRRIFDSYFSPSGRN